MAITSGICNSYKQELYSGIHTATDTYKIALYTSAASLSQSTTNYITANEVVGQGYTAGGATMVGFTTSNSGNMAILDWTTDPTWANATFVARGALIYNSSKSNKAVCVMDFGVEVSSNKDTFIVQLPVPDAITGLIRLA